MGRDSASFWEGSKDFITINEQTDNNRFFLILHLAFVIYSKKNAFSGIHNCVTGSFKDMILLVHMCVSINPKANYQYHHSLSASLWVIRSTNCTKEGAIMSPNAGLQWVVFFDGRTLCSNSNPCVFIHKFFPHIQKVFDHSTKKELTKVTLMMQNGGSISCWHTLPFHQMEFSCM